MKSLFKDQGFKRTERSKTVVNPHTREPGILRGARVNLSGEPFSEHQHTLHIISLAPLPRTRASQAAGTPGLNTQCNSSLDFPMPVPQALPSHLLQGGWSYCLAPMRTRTRRDPRPLTKLSACEWTRGGTGRAYTQLTGCIRSCREEGQEGRPRTIPKPRNPTKLTAQPHTPGPRLSVCWEEQKYIWKSTEPRGPPTLQPPYRTRKAITGDWGCLPLSVS